MRLDRAYAAHLFNRRPDLMSPNPVLRDELLADQAEMLEWSARFRKAFPWTRLA